MAQPPKGYWECEKCGNSVSNNENTCPHCGAKKEEAAQSNDIDASRQQQSSTDVNTSEEYIAESNVEDSNANSGENALSYVFTFCAVIVWICGIIIAFVLANVPSGYRNETEFNFWIFLGILAGTGVAGCFPLAIAQALKDLRRIADNSELINITLNKQK